MARHVLPLAFALFLVSCAPGREVLDVVPPERPPEVIDRDDRAARVQFVQPERPARDVAPDRTYDLLHTALDLSFDFEGQRVLGTATHRLRPLFDGLTEVFFHAEDMTFEGAELDGSAVPVRTVRGGVVVSPAVPLRSGQEYVVSVRYTATPRMPPGTAGFGATQGLYFVDPTGIDPFRPTQIWTQGQTSDNRRWFPTWDYPNDRMTFEIALTVPDSLRTVSNGRLAASTVAGPGLRRDRWVLDQSQPAYLAAVVAGRYATVRDTVHRADGSYVPLEYIVEPEYEQAARRIFGETPAMLRYFERVTGVLYPWPDYKQVVVRDFIAGGMESTTVTIMFEGLQTDERAWLDYTGRDLIAHELVHHWFGNLVTTRDWANLAINESFASYFEGLYLEDAHGWDAAQDHSIADRLLYFEQARQLQRPIVWYAYRDEGQMFDRHTYQKGAQVLQQLRFELGDELWWRAINHFLNRHAFRPVDIDDVRRSFEEATGRSLRRFFEQWFRSPGHPVLEVEQAHFPGSGTYTVRVTQVQPRAHVPVFHFDTNIELNFSGAPRELHRVRIMSADTTLRFNVPERPRYVRFNEGNWTLAELRITQPLEEQIAQATEDDEMAGRLEATRWLGQRDLAPRVRETLMQVAANDAHQRVREAAVQGLARYHASPGVPEALARIAREDAEPVVRRAALAALANVPDAVARPVLIDALGDPSYQTVAQAVRAYAERFPDDAFDQFQPILRLDSWRGVVEMALVEAAVRVRGQAAFDYLLYRAGPMNPDNVRSAAVIGLGGRATEDPALRPAAVETLTELLADHRETVRLRAAQAFGRIGDPEALGALEARLLQETAEAVRAALNTSIEELRRGRTILN